MMNQSLNSKEVLSRFNVERILGEGAFATVYKASTKIRAEDVGIHCFNNRSSIHRKLCHRPKYGDTVNQSDCSPKQRDHNRIVSLKIVNVSKVAKRRSERNKSDGGGKGEVVGHERKDGINRRENNEVCEVTSSIYDTEQLFFPSRIVDKTKTTTKCLERNDCDVDDNDEYFSTKKMLQREISVHLNVSKYCHPNILTMLESFQYNISGINGKDLIVAMVMEYCPYGDLNQYLRQKRDERRAQHIESNPLDDNGFSRQSKLTLLHEKEIQHAMRHILRGLAFLHSRGIVHRDIKAGNILLSMSPSSEHKSLPSGKYDGNHEICNQNSFTLFDCCLKIGDFGLAVQMSDDDDWDDAQHTLCGTPSCLAPEVALSTPQTSKERIAIMKNNHSLQEQVNEDIRGHGQPADLWSVGCLLYVMLIGKYPFSLSRIAQRPDDAQNIVVPCKLMKMQETLKKVVQGDWSIPRDVSLSEHATKLLSQLLSYDPKKRGFARGLLSSHSFFKQTSKDLIVQSGHEKSTRSRSKLSQQSLMANENGGSARDDSNVHLYNVKQKRYQTPLCERTNHRQYQPTESGYVNDHTKQGSQHCKERNTASQCTSFVNPIKNLHLLPVTKHQWESTNISGSAKSFTEAKKIRYTAYVLPAAKGIVFECEKTSGSGAWMHVTGDGNKICMGKLSRKPIQAVQALQLNDESILYHEAFSRRPKKYKRIQDTQHGCIKYNENQSMCTMGPLHSTLFSAPSTSSVPILTHRNVANMRYKKLSSLLQKKNRTFLLLYRKLSKFVRELIKNIPKLFLSIHECKKIKSSSTETYSLSLLCTVQLVEQPKSLITVTFVDGLTLQYDLSSGVAKINASGPDGKSVRSAINIFLRKNLLSQIEEKVEVEFYYPYVQFAKSAIKKIIETEREFIIESKAPGNSSMGKSSSMIPRRRKLVVQGKSFKNWIDITETDMLHMRNDQKKMIGSSRISRVLIEDSGDG